MRRCIGRAVRFVGEKALADPALRIVHLSVSGGGMAAGSAADVAFSATRVPTIDGALWSLDLRMESCARTAAAFIAQRIQLKKFEAEY